MTKYIITFFLSIFLVLTVGFAIKQYQDNKALKALYEQRNEQLMQANLEIGRAETKLLEAEDLHRIYIDKIKTLDKKLSDEINKREAVVTQYGELEARYNKVVKKVRTLTKIITGSSTQPVVVEIPEGKLFYKDKDGELKEIKTLRYSYSDFRIDIAGDVVKQELTYKLHQRFKVHLVETKLPTGGKNHYVKLYELGDKGEKVQELEITKFQVVSSNNKTSNKFNWWDPKLDLGVVGEVLFTTPTGIMTGELGFSIFSYGKPDALPALRFLRVSVGGSSSGFSFGVSPVQWNLGKTLPVVENLWLYPRVGYTLGRGASIGVGLSVVF